MLSIMISKRITSLYRRITVCLTLILFSLFFVLSCQKDEGLKQKDLNALTKAQAKEYFEQTASTLKFLTAGTIPAGTKNADYSLTENMIINWDQALEGETADSYVVEVPISMVSPITALMYDGVGHFNKNIHQAQMNASLLIEKHKADGCMHHLLVTTVGSYSKAVANTKYGFLCDKASFSGYQIFSSEEGIMESSKLYSKGLVFDADLLPTDQMIKVDSLGTDRIYSGLRFGSSSRPSTKGGGGLDSGEDFTCPYCGGTLSNEGGYYVCNNCIIYFYDMFDVRCPYCLELVQYCTCVCPKCGFPNRYFNTCMCNPPSGDQCPYCGTYGCNGQCGGGADSTENMNTTYSLLITTNNQGGYVSKSIERSYYFYNEYILLTAHPNSGYTFNGWYEDNILISSNLQYSFSITCDRVLVAFFEED